MRQILIISIFIFLSNIIYSQTTVTLGEILNFQNGTAQARENDIYVETTNNQYYIGLANGKVKFLQDTVRINSTLTGNGSVGSPIGIAQQSATSGQVLSWNGTAWVPSNAAPATATVSNTVTAPNSLQTTVNGITGTAVNMITVVSNTSSVNNLSTTVNGVTGTAAPIINTNSVSSASGNITSTVNGISSGAIALAGITTSNLSPSAGIVNGQLANSSVTVNGTSIALGGSGTVTAAPSGTAGGDLTGTYPNPTIGTGKVTSTNILDGTVANADLGTMATNTIKANATAGIASPSDLSITANSLLGRGTGNLTPISLGTGLSISGSTLNANSGTVTNVTGTSPISVATGTTTPVISIARNNMVSGTSSNVATNPLVLDAGATNAVVGGANATLTVNNTAPLWNANQLQGRNITSTAPTTGQSLSWSGTDWAPVSTTVSNTVTALNSLQTTVNGITGTAVNMVTAVSNTSSTNNLSTTVNGIAGSNVPIINSVSNSINSGQLTTTVNGVSSTALTLPVPDGSETKINNGTNTTVSGSGTTGTPYTVSVADATTTTKGVVQLTGDLSGTATSPQIANNAVTTAKILDGTVANADMANMTALSVKGNATSSAAVPTDIAAGTDGHVLRRSGTTLGFGQVATTGITDNAVTYAKIQNVAASRLLGNPTGSSAVPSEITLGTGLSFSGSVLNAVNSGTVTNVTGTSPISVATGTTTPVISITRNNIVSGTSSNVATNPLVLDGGATNAVVGGANATLTVNNTAPLWNANQLQGRNIASTVPTTGQLLSWNGSNWAPSNSNLNWLVDGNNNAVYNTNFLGTTNDVPMTIRSNNTSMLEVGRRQSLGLYDSGSTGLFPYNQPNASVSYIRGTGGNSALQFEASGASFYKPLLFTDTDGNFLMRGSSAGTDFFELGSAGASNNGSLLFTIGDDGDEPMIFRKYNYSPAGYVEMLRMQGTGLNNNVRVGVNTGGVTANSTLEVEGSVSHAITTSSVDITLNETHYTVIISANVNVTLPAANTCQGRYYIIKKTFNGTSTITSYIVSNGSGSSTNLARDIYHLQSDGANWQRVN